MVQISFLSPSQHWRKFDTVTYNDIGIKLQNCLKHKLFTWLGHHFQGQKSRSPGRFTHRRVGMSGSCSGGRENVLAVRNCCYVAVCLVACGASAPMGEERGGACRGGRPPIACYMSCYALCWVPF